MNTKEFAEMLDAHGIEMRKLATQIAEGDLAPNDVRTAMVKAESAVESLRADAVKL